jgi:ribosomal protein S18 acetylase RimI-like enzyme
VKNVELRIRPAQNTDLDQLVALDARAFSQSDRYRRREWAALLYESLRGGPTRIVVASVAEAVMGAVVVAANVDREDSNIVSLAVDTPYRRRGLARQLLSQALIDQPPEIRTVSLEVREENSGARALYERLGFQVIRRMRKYYPDGAAALRYRAPLQDVVEACQVVRNGDR